MPYGFKKMLEIEAERKKRREEKAKIKAEKEKQKLEEKKEARRKRLKQKRNARYFAKKRKIRDEQRRITGDEKGMFSIYLMRDGKRTKFLGSKRLKNAALQLYHQILDENNSKVMFKQKGTKLNRKMIEHKYELILTKKLKDDDTDNISMLRNEDGKFIKNYFTDTTTHKIIDKNERLVEETFWVYGFDPQKDRKDFNYIYNNIILKNPSNYTRLFVYNNKLIHHYDDDFDFVNCKNIDQAIELYDTIEKTIDKKKYPNVFFMGRVRGSASAWVIDELMEKTGWTRPKCREPR